MLALHRAHHGALLTINGAILTEVTYFGFPQTAVG